MIIVNPGGEDFHMHSLNFSDGMNTVEEIVQYAGKIGLTKIAITDHSQIMVEKKNRNFKGFRSIVKRWHNVHNDVEVIFGVEGDLINEDGNVCFDYQGITPEFVILSAHKGIYEGDFNTVTQGYINAIKKHHNKIKFIGHPCSSEFENYVDIQAVTKVANEYGIGLEFNAKNFVNGKTSMSNLHTMLSLAQKVYVNSDAHTLYELSAYRGQALEYLKTLSF